MASTSGALRDVAATVWGMEYSVHGCSSRVAREVAPIFPGVSTDNLLIVPTCQRADVDLVKTGDPVEGEKDRLLERFLSWAKLVCDKLAAEGFWADYIDPCSGLPMVHRDTNTVYSEVEGLSLLLGYKTANAGCCKVVLHPVWGSSVYPATLFSQAPLERLVAAIAQAEAELLQGS